MNNAGLRDFGGYQHLHLEFSPWIINSLAGLGSQQPAHGQKHGANLPSHLAVMSCLFTGVRDRPVLGEDRGCPSSVGDAA